MFSHIREMSESEFIEQHASGTLRKNKRLGFSYKGQYLEERTAWEFGFAFEIVPSSRVTQGIARTEGDCHPVTESGWHAERYMALNRFPEDKWEVKYLQIEIAGEKNRREGIGLVLTSTPPAWVPPGQIILCIITEYCHNTHDFLPAKNPA